MPQKRKSRSTAQGRRAPRHKSPATLARQKEREAKQVAQRQASSKWRADVAQEKERLASTLSARLDNIVGGKPNDFESTTGVPHGTLQGWLQLGKGYHSLPGLEYLRLVARRKDTSVDWLLGSNVSPRLSDRELIGEATLGGLKRGLFDAIVSGVVTAIANDGTLDVTEDQIGTLMVEKGWSQESVWLTARGAVVERVRDEVIRAKRLERMRWAQDTDNRLDELMLPLRFREALRLVLQPMMTGSFDATDEEHADEQVEQVRRAIDAARLDLHFAQDYLPEAEAVVIEEEMRELATQSPKPLPAGASSASTGSLPRRQQRSVPSAVHPSPKHKRRKAR